MKKRSKTKFDPLTDKEYIVTDQCWWKSLTEEQRNQYNPYDKTREPHSIQLVDPDTGTIVNLISGSRIRVIKSYENN